MGFEFANPAMLFGTLLFGVPIAIHLLNKRRYKIKSWAAMSFLLKAHKRRRRRLRLENLLLLLLRCLIIILLALAMARPFVPADSLLSGLTDTRRNVVAVLDRSYSMGYRIAPDETCFDAALAGIKSLIKDLDSSRGDTFSLLLMGDEVAFFVPLDSMPEDALAKVENSRASPFLREPSQGGADFAALAALLAGDVTASLDGEVEVFIFTDMQARFLGEGERAAEGDRPARGATAALLAKAVERGAAIRFVDILAGRRGGVSGSGTLPNRTVSDVVPLSPNITTNAAVTFSATISNYGDEDLTGLSGAFLLDGKTAEKRTVDIRARGRATVELTSTFREAGFHTLSFRLDGDNLPVDDERHLAFEARDSINVLLVDGAYTFDPFERPSGLVGLMLNPVEVLADPDVAEGGEAREAAGSIFNPVTVDFKIFNAGREDPSLYDCVIFADVEGLSSQAASALFDSLSSGGQALFFMGNRVDLKAWNLRLYDDETRRLLPAPLKKVVGDPAERGRTSFYRLTARDFSHPVMKVFDDPKLKVLLSVPVFRFVELGPPADGMEEARVIAWFADPLGNRFPAIVEHNVGRGRVILFTTSADASWSLIPESPKTYLPLLHELLFYMTAVDPGIFNLAVGETITRSVVEFPERIAITGPDGSTRTVTEAVERREFGRFVLPLSNFPLDRAGPTLLDVDSSVSGKSLREIYAANVDPLEGDLERVDAAVLAALFPGVKLSVVDSVVSVGERAGGAASGEFWKQILWALLALTALELFLSWKFGDYS